MAILLDSNFFIAVINKDDNNFKRANILLEDLLAGNYGARITTDYVLDEAITVTWIRTKKKDYVQKVYELFIGKEAICILYDFPFDLLPETWNIFTKYSSSAKPLSFTDCSLIAFAENRNIKTMLSFDAEYDGILTRLS